MKHYSLFILLLAIYSCGQPPTNNISYFQFDSVVHYRSHIAQKGAISLLIPPKVDIEPEPDKAYKESLSKIIVGSVPADINDSGFLYGLDTLDFTSVSINDKYHDSLNYIFSSKDNDTGFIEHFKCTHIYRDIIVFRNNGQLTGIAKLCFDCYAHQIVGTKKSTAYFGQGGEYVQLKMLLDDNSSFLVESLQDST